MELAAFLCILFAMGVLLTIILVPLSFSYVDYYEYGLKQRKSNGRVATSTVYTRGRYNLGPDFHFIKYQADSHFESLGELSVFSAGGNNESIGLEFKIDVDFTFFLIKEEIGILHQELASSYEGVLLSRVKDAIKNEATSITFEEYFQERAKVELRFRNAIVSRWNETPSLHCVLDQFHLGRIQIPDAVATKQLEIQVQNERNSKEESLQKAQVEREITSVEVNRINLNQSEVLRTAEAEASLIRANAHVEAQRTITEAEINGTKFLFDTAGIKTQEQMIAYSYIRTLTKRQNLDLSVSYITNDNIVRTRAA